MQLNFDHLLKQLVFAHPFSIMGRNMALTDDDSVTGFL